MLHTRESIHSYMSPWQQYQDSGNLLLAHRMLVEIEDDSRVAEVLVDTVHAGRTQRICGIQQHLALNNSISGISAQSSMYKVQCAL